MRALSSLTAVLFLILVAPAGAAVSTPQSGWLWGSPQPQGNTLTALELQGNTGYAAGGFGTLLRTSDGGTGWTTVRTGYILDFADLDMIDEDSLVIGSQCAARRTDDGGKTFRRLPFTSSERRCARQLQGISFPTPDVGYLLTVDGGVLRTTDGGRSFSARTAVPTGQGAPTAVMFRNETDGLLTTSDGDIFRTTNSGDSWTREYNGEPNVGLNGVLFTSGQAVAVGNGGTFLVSTDGGDTWTRPAGTPPTVDFVDVRCASAAVCLISARANRIYRTGDGGTTFTDAGISNGLAVDFASPTRGVVVGFRGATHVSDDGGASFRPLGALISSVVSLTKVRATSASVAYAVGTRGALARTTNGGDTWTNVGVATGEQVGDAWFPNASVGYAFDVVGGLFRTDNGGGSWSILETGTDDIPHGIFAPDAETVFLIGPRGVLRSRDSGESFEPHTDRVIRNRTLEEADQAGSAVVFYGPRVIALSTNDGKSWRQIPRPTQRSEVVHVDFVSSKVGYVLATDGRIYFTRNRGATWAEVPATGYDNGRRLAFGDRRHGWLMVSSRRPNVLRTTDGGKSWTPQVLGGQGITGLAAFGAQTGFATLPGPSVLFTRNGGNAGAASRLTLSTDDRSVRRGKKVVIKGRLSPAEGGEDVEVRVRRVNGGRWREIDVFPKKNGRFSFEQRIRRSTMFVAQWEGDPDSNGDGSRPLVVRVG